MLHNFIMSGSLIGSAEKFAKGGGVASKEIKKRLEEIRKELRAEKISYGELAELQSLKKYIDPSDVELLEAAGVPEKHEDGGGVAEGWTDAELMAKGGKLYGDKFVEIGGYDENMFYARNFGHVETEKKGKIELAVVAQIMDLEGAVPKNELPKDGNFQLDITIVPYEKYISKKLKESATEDSGGGNLLMQVVEYMGGVNYQPQEKVHFKTQKDAEKYLFSKELNDQISGNGLMSGFIMDRQFNRAGQTNWERLAYMTGESDKFYAEGGGVANGWSDSDLLVRGGKVKQKGTSVSSLDKLEKAKRVGYRFTDKKAKQLHLGANAKPTEEEIKKMKNGKGVYYENRKNRSDKSRMKKLEDGGVAEGWTDAELLEKGGAAKAKKKGGGNSGMMAKIQSGAKALRAEHPSMKWTDCIKKSAANLKAKGELHN